MSAIEIMFLPKTNGHFVMNIFPSPNVTEPSMGMGYVANGKIETETPHDTNNLKT